MREGRGLPEVTIAAALAVVVGKRSGSLDNTQRILQQKAGRHVHIAPSCRTTHEPPCPTIPLDAGIFHHSWCVYQNILDR